MHEGEVVDANEDALQVGETGAAASYKLVEECFQTHNEIVGKRLKTTPALVSSKPADAVVIATESLEDQDICKGMFNLWLTAATEEG